MNGITWSITHHPNSLEELAVDLLDKHTHTQLGVSCPAMCHVHNESPPITDGEKIVRAH